jgi:predicted DNA binding CopG/RHH family protein
VGCRKIDGAAAVPLWKALRTKEPFMSRARKPIPSFDTEAEERAFWERADSTAHLDWSRAKRMRLPNLQPSKTAISLRLPVSLLEQIKIAANKRDVPYQSLIKMWLSEKVG